MTDLSDDTGQNRIEDTGLLRDVPEPADRPATRPAASEKPAAKLPSLSQVLPAGGKTRSHEVLPGEYDGLLENFNALARKMGLDTPPKLKVIEGTSLTAFGGAHGSATGVTIDANLLKILDADELEFTLAHELGHTRQHRAKQDLKTPEDCEKDADRQAVLATRNPKAGISGLFKIAAAQMAELPKLVPGISEASLQKAQKETDETVRWRTENIRNTPLP